jgi:hypothetical protein
MIDIITHQLALGTLPAGERTATRSILVGLSLILNDLYL